LKEYIFIYLISSVDTYCYIYYYHIVKYEKKNNNNLFFHICWKLCGKFI